MGIFYAAPLLGASLGPLLGGILTQAFSWRASSQPSSASPSPSSLSPSATRSAASAA